MERPLPEPPADKLLDSADEPVFSTLSALSLGPLFTRARSV